jgi:hypothetical protein
MIQKKASVLLMACITTMIFADQSLAQSRRRSSQQPVSAPAVRGDSAAYSVAGCGLGSLAFKDHKKNKWMQVLAATTNGTSFNQTFGISTGTLNCELDGSMAKYSEQDMFVAANYEQLTREAAVGQGESLATLAKLMGCDDQATAAFGSLTKSQFEAIFQGTSAMEPKTVVSNIKTAVSADAALAPSCGLASL